MGSVESDKAVNTCCLCTAASIISHVSTCNTDANTDDDHHVLQRVIFSGLNFMRHTSTDRLTPEIEDA